MKKKQFLLIFGLFGLIELRAQSFEIIKQEFVYNEAPFPSCHASTIAETPNGLVAAWFGGKHEKNPDVEIYVSRKENGIWTTPVSVANGIQHDTKRYPCWNPVLFQVPSGPLLLFYKVGPDPRNWWGEMTQSEDNGITWSSSHRLPEDILGPVKNKPILLSDGRLLCPSSKEFEEGDNDYWQVFLETTSDFGKTWSISKPLNDGVEAAAIQPSILTHADGKMQMICRSKENRLVSFWSLDNGFTWSNLEITDVPNPNSGTDAVTLSTGLQVLVYNPTERFEGKWGGPRSPLSVGVSKDGKIWTKLLDLETAEGEYSYPAIIEGVDGSVHITYTHKRSKIKYVNLKLKP